MKVKNDTQIVAEVLKNKIEREEETLQLLVRTGLWAEDRMVHDQMICTQQQIVNFYKDLLDKVSTFTIKH